MGGQKLAHGGVSKQLSDVCPSQGQIQHVFAVRVTKSGTLPAKLPQKEDALRFRQAFQTADKGLDWFWKRINEPVVHRAFRHTKDFTELFLSQVFSRTAFNLIQALFKPADEFGTRLTKSRRLDHWPLEEAGPRGSNVSLSSWLMENRVFQQVLFQL